MLFFLRRNSFSQCAHATGVALPFSASTRLSAIVRSTPGARFSICFARWAHLREQYFPAPCSLIFFAVICLGKKVIPHWPHSLSVRIVATAFSDATWHDREQNRFGFAELRHLNVAPHCSQFLVSSRSLTIRRPRLEHRCEQNRADKLLIGATNGTPHSSQFFCLSSSE